MFIKKTVAGVLAGFQKTIADLRSIEAAKHDEALAIGPKIAELRIQQNAATAEASKAGTIAERLEKLLSA